MNMAVLHLPVYTVLLVGYVQAGVTDSDVTPRLTFFYSKYLLTPGKYNCCSKTVKKYKEKEG